MANTSRRQLLKRGASGAVALAALSGGAASAQGRRGVHIHIHGVLSNVANPAGKLAISIDVAGRHDDLAGAGWDGGTVAGPAGMVPGGDWPVGPQGACYYTAAGVLDGDVVVLQGRSLFTNRPAVTLGDVEEPGRSDTRADGRIMNATADVHTGEITWSLSPAGAAFAGTGLVVVTHASRTSK